ncbi:hypothetical protein EAS62_08785 [Bradyrhizobium zhanjiangense]|uniref:Uncharacterized protein n=1 Tax=Bradyrhizobium zhanjiangense TaxID=1325107 RepID=A0ABY0DQM8_9BRAD|nr:hypothetical protein EAS62_08785 [Bradyrhizobium zhanjiangense]
MLRHCEEPLRRNNPESCRGKTLDCFATLAMTALMQLRSPNSSWPPPRVFGACRLNIRQSCPRRRWT